MTLKARLMKSEGLRLSPYQDIFGKITIGWGRNLSDVGITESEALMMLDHDILIAERDTLRSLPWTASLDEVRFGVLVDMAFNMGITRLLTFKNTLAAVQARNYAKAAEHMLDSKWAWQVGQRAVDLAEIMKKGT